MGKVCRILFALAFLLPCSVCKIFKTAFRENFISNYIYIYPIGFDGLEVACWPLVSKFAGSNPAETVGFLRAEKSSARLSSEGK
jgi:hypothetical protein